MSPIHICGIPADRILSRGYSGGPSLPASTTAISVFAFAVAAIYVPISLRIRLLRHCAIVIASTAILEVTRISTAFADFAGFVITAIAVATIVTGIAVLLVTEVAASAIKQNLQGF